VWPQIIDNELLQEINRPTIKLYLWLPVKQGELAQRNEFVMRISDAEVAPFKSPSKVKARTVGVFKGLFFSVVSKSVYK
jgi:hypothetical protein